MQFNNLPKYETEYVSVKINDENIAVKQYLPINQKYELIMTTVEESFEDGSFNSIKQEMFFNLNLVYMYTDIEFTDEDKDHPAAIYDTLEVNGVFDEVIKAIPNREMNTLYDFLKAVTKEKQEMNKSLLGAVKSFFIDIPKLIDEAGEQLNEFDAEKYENVVNMAKAIGAKI